LHAQREWQDRYRFEELEDTSDEGEYESLAPGEIVGDSLQFTGFDMATDRRQRRGNQSRGQAGLIENDQQYQVNMLDMEDELVERALRRIRRARLRGEPDVNLSREELDALERSQMIPRAALSRHAEGLQSRAVSGSDRENIDRRKVSSPAKAKPRQSLPPSERSSPHRRSNNSSPQHQEQISRPQSRTTQRNPGAPPAGFMDPRVYDQAVAMGYRPRSSSRSSQRSLPDDPDWVPMSRSRGATSSGLAAPAPESIIQRRNVSGPAGVSYAATQRRPSPLPSSAPLGGQVRQRGPGDDATRQRVASGLKQEIIEISSDDEESDYNAIGASDDEEEEEEPQVQSRFARPKPQNVAGSRQERRRH